jgi:hypothetical protein
MVGGVSDYVRLIAGGLTEAGEDVHVWCPAGGMAQAGDPWTVHPELGGFRRADRKRAGALLDRFPGPRRLLVQWVPHGYGFESMNLAFCVWLWRRAVGGDQIELMVHEPYLAFWEGNWRQNAAAVVHRVMTTVLLRAASRVWMSIPAWEKSWRPYALGRAIPFAWLPIPTGLIQPDAQATGDVRARLDAGRHPIIGHFGRHGGHVASLLNSLLPEVLRQLTSANISLIGFGSDRFRAEFLKRYPMYSERITATGAVSDRALAEHVTACDVLIQPYPDGVSSRRTTAMAGLRHAQQLVTPRDRRDETLWR